MKQKFAPVAAATFSLALSVAAWAADAKAPAAPAIPKEPAAGAPKTATPATPAVPVKPPTAADDAASAKGLVGSWTETQKAPGPGMSDIKVADTYNADGTWKSEATVAMGGQSMTMSVAGKWKVAEGLIVTVVESSNPPGLAAGHETSKEQVLSVTANEATTIDEDTGDKIVKTRTGK